MRSAGIEFDSGRVSAVISSFDRSLAQPAIAAVRLKEERQNLYLMDSTRPNPTFLTAQIGPTMSGTDAYSSKKELAFLLLDSDAGFVAGVFFSQPERRVFA